MEVVRNVLNAFKPYNNKALILGAAMIATHLAVYTFRGLRRTNKLVVGLKSLNIRPYVDGRQEPWAVILFNQGPPKVLKRLCEALVIAGVNVFVITSPRNQQLMDILQAEFIKTHRKFRYSFRQFKEYENIGSWSDLHFEFKEVDARLLIHFGDEGHMGWRTFEEIEKKKEEATRVLGPQYSLALALHAFAQLPNDGRRAVVQIDSSDDRESNHCDDTLLEGICMELRTNGVEYKRVIDLQTFINHEIL